MSVNLVDYQKINNVLEKAGIKTILYGSLGVSCYLGNFREFDDIDLLVDPDYLANKWPLLKAIMFKEGFILVDEKEHEFHSGKTKVAFAQNNVLSDDEICDPNTDVVKLSVNGINVHTISPEAYVKAYTFSSTDGYRLEKRGNADLKIVEALKKLSKG